MTRHWQAFDFLGDRSGQVGIIFAATMMPMSFLVGSAVDFGRAYHARTVLQGAVDAAVLAAAALEDDQVKDVETKAKAIFKAKTAGTILAATHPRITVDGRNVTVAINAGIRTSFLRLMDLDTIDISVRATAQSGYDRSDDDSERGKVCLLALDPASDDGIHIQGDNDVSHPDCWAYVNSARPTAINGVGSQATAVGEGYCAVGGYVAEHRNFKPDPRVGCAGIADPFATVGAYGTAGRYTPSFTPPAIPSSCTANNLNLKKGQYTLLPGRYCGGLSIQAQARVRLEPGVYIIDNGELLVQSGSSLTGSNVAFYLTGPNAHLTIIGGGTVDLKGRQSGASLAGMLFVAHPDAWRGRDSNIQGGGTFNLEGVLYLPTQRIEVSGNGDVNDDGRYFAMVAKDFYFRGNGMFHLRKHDEESTLPDILPEMPREDRQDARLTQ